MFTFLFVKDFSKKITLCIDCNKPISYGSKRCEECAKIAQRTVARPSREEFKDLISEENVDLEERG